MSARVVAMLGAAAAFSAMIVAGAGSGAREIEISPGVLNPRGERWTFLVRGVPITDIGRVTLHIGDEVLEACHRDPTTETSGLWTFQYAPLSTHEAPLLNVWGNEKGGGSLLASRDLDWFRDPWGYDAPCRPGLVHAWFGPWELGYAPGVPERQLDELDGPAFRTRLVLEQLGTTVVRKVYYTLPDSATSRIHRGERRDVLPSLNRAYQVVVDSSHSTYAICEIMKELGIVERCSCDPPGSRVRLFR